MKINFLDIIKIEKIEEKNPHIIEIENESQNIINKIIYNTKEKIDVIARKEGYYTKNYNVTLLERKIL